MCERGWPSAAVDFSSSGRGSGRHSGGCPCASFVAVPVSCSAARLKRVIRPRGPTATTPLSMVSSTLFICSFICTTRAWVCAFRTATAAWFARVVSRSTSLLKYGSPDRFAPSTTKPMRSPSSRRGITTSAP